MGEYTLKVPAEHVEMFRQNVYSRLASEGDVLDKRAVALAFPGGRSWDEFIADDQDKIESYAVDVLKATRNIAALVEVMDQLGWTDPIEGDVELAADPKVLGSLIGGCLVDAGSTIHKITDATPFDRPSFEVATARGVWLADRSAEVETAAV